MYTFVWITGEAEPTQERQRASVPMINLRWALVKAGCFVVDGNILPLEPRRVFAAKVGALPTVQAPACRKFLELDAATPVAAACAVAAHDDVVLAVPAEEVERRDRGRYTARARDPHVGLHLEVLLGHEVRLRAPLRRAVQVQEGERGELAELPRVLVLPGAKVLISEV